MGFKYYIEYSDGKISESDKEYDSEQEAEDERENSVSAYSQGGDALELAGSGACSARIVDSWVEEV